MKMAKASKADMEMALKLCSALEAIDRRFFPEGAEGENDPDEFDLGDDEHCGMALRHLYDILQGGSIGRVIWGMYVLMDPTNKIIDPDASTLELHPEFAAAEADADRYRWLKACNSGSIGITTFNTDEALERVLVDDDADAEIDAAMAAAMHANG